MDGEAGPVDGADQIEVFIRRGGENPRHGLQRVERARGLTASMISRVVGDDQVEGVARKIVRVRPVPLAGDGASRRYSRSSARRCARRDRGALAVRDRCAGLGVVEVEGIGPRADLGNDDVRIARGLGVGGSHVVVRIGRQGRIGGRVAAAPDGGDPLVRPGALFEDGSAQSHFF